MASSSTGDVAPRPIAALENDVGLDILAVGHANIPTRGYALGESLSRGPMRDVTIPCSRVLVVRGAGSTVLLSTRMLELDGVNAYFNADNSIKTSNCLFDKKRRIVVPFNDTSGAYEISADFERACAARTHLVDRAVTPRAVHPAHLVHRALGHCGPARATAANLIIDGMPVSAARRDPASCRGCRLGNTSGVTHRRTATAAHGRATQGFEHFGQQMDSDICFGFEPSFPHGFRCMLNFCDRHTHETFLYFLVHQDAHEIRSSLLSLNSAVSHRLRDGRFGRWVTDNGKGFLSEEVDELARELAVTRGFQIPNDSDTLPVPERHWGVLQRTMRSDLSHADAPRCLWPWTAHQANLLLYYLPTRALRPPQSPYAFSTGDSSPVDISWARTMFCDVTVTIPTRDRAGKLGDRSADGCHLGYDPRRGAHFVFVPCLSRISTFTVSEWREESFTVCKGITADTPVNYPSLSDLPIAPITSSMLPRMHAGRAAVDAPRALHVMLLFPGPPVPHSIATLLRERGHSVTPYDIAICSGHDLRGAPLRKRVIDSVPYFDFVFMCPPCTTACIANWPPLRTVTEPYGVSSLTNAQRAVVKDANKLYTLCGDVARACNTHRVGFAIESAASRRVGPVRCRWPRFASNGFLWDFPAIATLPDVVYKCFAQCAFGAEYQKYTGYICDDVSAPAFARVFDHAQCECTSHAVRLQGYDDTGVSHTSAAAAYVPRLARGFVAAIEDACFERDSARAAAGSDAACSACDAVPTRMRDYSHAGMQRALAAAHTIDRLDHNAAALRVSEVGSIPVPATARQARASKHWPLFRDAINSELKGKLKNKA